MWGADTADEEWLLTSTHSEISLTPRREVLDELVARLPPSSGRGVLRVAIDGVDGAGKTHLADELAELLSASGRSTIRASVDGFHNPRAIRYRRGRDSPEGFFLDSYDYDGLKAALLDPLSPTGTKRYRVAIFDHRSDEPVGEGSPDPAAPENRRYVQGQELYLSTCEPVSFASVTVNNDDLAAPYFVAGA